MKRGRYSWEIDAFDPIQFAKEKAYAERTGWTNVTWINGYTVGKPPPRPWNRWLTDLVPVGIPEGQLELGVGDAK